MAPLDLLYASGRTLSADLLELGVLKAFNFFFWYLRHLDNLGALLLLALVFAEALVADVLEGLGSRGTDTMADLLLINEDRLGALLIEVDTRRVLQGCNL